MCVVTVSRLRKSTASKTSMLMIVLYSGKHNGNSLCEMGHPWWILPFLPKCRLKLQSTAEFKSDCFSAQRRHLDQPRILPLASDDCSSEECSGYAVCGPSFLGTT